ncbi:MAG: hypothetical protein RL240_4237 [Planctomycetota bacterium]|jgi:hypothetical protein
MSMPAFAAPLENMGLWAALANKSVSVSRANERPESSPIQDDQPETAYLSIQ